MNAHVAPDTVEKPLISRKYATFNPDPGLTTSLRDPFPAGLRFPVDHIGPADGKTILIVSDRISRHDLPEGRIFSGEEGVVYDNIVDYSLSQVDPDVKVGRIILFPWALSWTAENDRSDHASYNHCLQHFQRVVEHLQPDTILISGIEISEFIFQNLNRRNPDLSTYVVLNRVQGLQIREQIFDVVPTIDLHRLCSFDKEKIKKFPNLIGFYARGMITAMNGRNRYTIGHFEQKINYIDTVKKFQVFYQRLVNARHVSIDCEGASLGRVTGRLFSIQFTFDGKSAYFLPLDHQDTPFTPTEIAVMKRKLRDYFEKGNSDFHMYQAGKFDIGQFINHLGVRYYNHRVYDVTAGEYALDENRKLLEDFRITKPKIGIDRYRPYTLNMMAEEYGCPVYRHIEFSKGDRGNIAQEGLTARFIEYSCYDVTVVYRLMQCQTAEARRRGHDKFMTFVCEQMSDTVIAFAHLENAGLLLDKRYLMSLLDKQGPIIKVIDETLDSFKKSKAAQKVNAYFAKRQNLPTKNLFGETEWVFSVKKRAHSQMLFFDVLGLEPIVQTKDGGGKLDKIFRAKYKESVPEVQIFEDFSKIVTIYNNFVKPLSVTIESDADALKDGRIRASFWFTEVVTSRTSSSNPNFQNIPQHGKLAKLVKRLFIAQRGRLNIENDYSAHEVRDWANQAGDETLASSFYAGLKYRQDLRILAYENPEAVQIWTDRKAELKWDEKGSDMKKADNRLKFIETLNDLVIKRLAELDFNIDAKGDIHRLNYQHFFGIDVLLVTDEQRQSVKAVVFGTIYGKTARGLAESLNISEEEAQALQDTLFEKFAQGGGWIKDCQSFGRANLYVETPVGMHRHLWGYLHARPSVLNAMDRRGPNSAIQGTASNIGVASMRIMNRLVYKYFIEQGLHFPHDQVVNYVHDSVKSEVEIQLIPIYMYLMEHASTTLIHKRMRETFDYKMKVGLEMEFQVGAAGSRAEKWNFMENNLMKLIKTEMEWQNSEFNFGLDIDAYLGAIKHNWDLIAPIRLEELKRAVKSKEPSETMLLTPKMVKGMGFQLTPPDTTTRNRFALAA